MVVFVHSTGDTHALSPAASAVLATMLDNPGSALSAAEWLEAAAQEEPAAAEVADADELHRFEVMLGELEAIGLVQRVAI